MERHRKMWLAVEKEHGVLIQREAYIALTAMEWADKTMIERAYKWILCNMSNYVKVYQLDIFINNEDMANDFKQVMEE